MSTPDGEWSKPYCHITHMMRNKIQHSVTDCGNFAELFIYSWRSHQTVNHFYFFKAAYDQYENFDDKRRFWSCGKQAVEIAKTFAEYGEPYEMSLKRMDMSTFDIKRYRSAK